jgi:hypothetical protein
MSNVRKRENFSARITLCPIQAIDGVQETNIGVES